MALAPWIKYHTYPFNYEAQLLWRCKIECKLLCSFAGFLFLEFSWGEFLWSVGVFFFFLFPPLSSTRCYWAENFTRTCLVFLLKPRALVFLCEPSSLHSGAQRHLGVCIFALGPKSVGMWHNLSRGWEDEIEAIKHLLSRGHVAPITSFSCRHLPQGVRGENLERLCN